MKLFTRVVIHRNWQDIDVYDLNEIDIDRLPEKIKELIKGGDPLLIEIALWNERERNEMIEENSKD